MAETECIVCSSTDHVISHHTSYENEETVLVCRSCHMKIHNDETHPLHPDDERKTAQITIGGETKQRIDRLKGDDTSYDSVVSGLLSIKGPGGSEKQITSEMVDRSKMVASDGGQCQYVPPRLEVTVTDPDEHESGKKVDDRGRVYVGTEYSGKRVRIVMEVEGEDE